MSEKTFGETFEALAQTSKGHPSKPLAPAKGSPASGFGLRIFCAHCGVLIVEPGALLFSPPKDNGHVEKHHFCVDCFHKIQGLLTQENKTQCE